MNSKSKKKKQNLYTLSGHRRVTHARCWSTTIRLATRRTWRHLNVLLACTFKNKLSD